MTYGHLRDDCLYTGISSGPALGIEYENAFAFYLLYIEKDCLPEEVEKETMGELAVPHGKWLLKQCLVSDCCHADGCLLLP